MPRAHPGATAGQALAGLGAAIWRLLTDVRFAVVLILLLALSGLVATLVRQFPVSAAEDPARYAAELAAVVTAPASRNSTSPACVSSVASFWYWLRSP